MESLKGMSTLKRQVVGYLDGRTLMDARLLVDLAGKYVVHVEIRYSDGSKKEAFLYRGSKIDIANGVYGHLVVGGMLR